MSIEAYDARLAHVAGELFRRFNEKAEKALALELAVHELKKLLVAVRFKWVAAMPLDALLIRRIDDALKPISTGAENANLKIDLEALAFERKRLLEKLDHFTDATTKPHSLDDRLLAWDLANSNHALRAERDTLRVELHKTVAILGQVLDCAEGAPKKWHGTAGDELTALIEKRNQGESK